MKKYEKISLLSLLIIPIIVLADTGNNMFDIGGAIGMEAFVSIHMSLFVLKPLSDLLAPQNSKKTFWTLFIIRAAILLFFDFFITPGIAMFDFFAVFIGAFLIVPIAAIAKKQTPFNNTVTATSTNTASTNITPTENEIVLNCKKCGGVLKVGDNFCTKCGAPFEGDNVVVSTKPKVMVTQSSFDPIYSYTEDKMLEEFINRELEKAGVDKNSTLIPTEILKRKNILNIIFSILVFVYVSLIFFHFPIYTYIIGIIILFIIFKLTRKYNLMKYLKKEVTSRPSEKISNIVMNVKNSFVNDNSKTLRVCCIILAAILPLFVFMSPRIMYEKVDNGYAVRFYTFGLNNFKTATIPETYKGEKVVSLRGNTFSNMPFLEKVTLPNTITEIRGQTFKNDRRLVKVNIPTNLEYLGGGAFYNCKSIKEIILPDTLTYMGGETFYNASSLVSVKLSKNLTEIRGDSFEYCTSLTSIEIPDNVTRIGGHAFYGDSSLSTVTLTENSQLKEIGSSAFRLCSNLYSITLPNGVYVNERAFKESPTVRHYFNEENNDYKEEKYNTNFDTSKYQNKEQIVLHDRDYDKTYNYKNGEYIISLSNFFPYTNSASFYISIDGKYNQTLALNNEKNYFQNDDFLLYVEGYTKNGDEYLINVAFYYN